MVTKLTENVWKRVADHCPSLPEIACAASLAYHNLHMLDCQYYHHLGWLCNTTLADVDVSSIPPEHLVSFMSCVGRTFNLFKVIGSGLVTILSNVNSLELRINNQTLDVEETKALVKSMEANGYRITLIIGDGVNLDIKTFTEYSGNGRCSGVRLFIFSDTATRYRDDLRTWAKNKQWRIDSDTDKKFEMRRK